MSAQRADIQLCPESCNLQGPCLLTDGVYTCQCTKGFTGESCAVLGTIFTSSPNGVPHYCSTIMLMFMIMIIFYLIGLYFWMGRSAQKDKKTKVIDCHPQEVKVIRMDTGNSK